MQDAAYADTYSAGDAVSGRGIIKNNAAGRLTDNNCLMSLLQAVFLFIIFELWPHTWTTAVEHFEHHTAKRYKGIVQEWHPCFIPPTWLLCLFSAYCHKLGSHLIFRDRSCATRFASWHGAAWHGTSDKCKHSPGVFHTGSRCERKSFLNDLPIQTFQQLVSKLLPMPIADQRRPSCSRVSIWSIPIWTCWKLSKTTDHSWPDSPVLCTH